MPFYISKSPAHVLGIRVLINPSSCTKLGEGPALVTFDNPVTFAFAAPRSELSNEWLTTPYET